MVTSASTNALKISHEYSENKVSALRESVGAIFPTNSNDTVLVCGSLARREAAGPSDVDFFLVSDDEDGRKERLEKIKEAVTRLGLEKPSPKGPFAIPGTRLSIIQNIGGAADSNANITQRILLLLEGDWLFNMKGFQDLRRRILRTYVKDGIPDDQVALFLLNDIIRYWRTVCVDYEYKTTAEANPKPWAIRNIKLVFSRKLIYASGLFSVASTADMAREEKIRRLEELFDLRPLDRLVHVCGAAATAEVLRSYEVFLSCINDDAKRCRLESLGKDDRDDLLYRNLKDEGHQFTSKLLKLFEMTFHATHPIRRAIVY